MSKQRLSVFISGKGTNAINLLHYFKNNTEIQIVSVLSTKENHEVSNLCSELNCQFSSISESPIHPQTFINHCESNNVDWIILAGFLKKIPVELIEKYPNKIINIHPSLLPKFGGKGMYGMNVHTAVIEAKETLSGITIHFVNEEFDKGKIIAQFQTSISASDTAIELAQKIHNLEMTAFPKVVEEVVGMV